MKVFVTAHPGSGKNEVVQLDPNHLEVFVTATAQKNRANQAIIELVARHFRVAKSLIVIKRGQTAKKKALEIELNQHLAI